MPDALSSIWGDAQPAPAATPKPAAQPDPSDPLAGARSAVAGGLHTAAGVVQEVHDQASEALSGMARDVTQQGESDKQRLEDELFSGAPINPRATRFLGHAADFAFSPMTGALTATAGKSVEEATGGAIPRRVTGDVLSIFVPLGGPAKGEKILAEAAKDAKLGADAAVRLFRGNPQLQRNVRDLIMAGVKPNLAVAAAMRGTRQTLSRVAGLHWMGGGVRRKIGETGEAIEGARGDLAKRMAGGGRIASTTEAGERVQKGVERFAESAAPDEFKDLSPDAVETLAKDARATPARKLGFGRKSDILYERADRLVGNPKGLIGLENTTEALKGITERFDNTRLRHLFENPVMGELNALLKKANGRLTWREARNLRTSIRTRLLGDAGLRATVDERTVKQLYAAISKDLAAGAYRLGGERAGKAYDEANRFYAVGMDRIDNALRSVTGKTGDAAFFDILRMAQGGPGRDLTRLTRLRNSLTPAEWRDFSATALEHMGLAKPGMATSQTEFSLQTFLTNMNKAGTRVGERAESGVDSGLKLLFQGAGREGDFAKLEAIANSAGMWQELRKFENLSRSGEHAGFGAESIGLVAAGLFNLKAAIIAASVGTAASKAIMSESFVRWLAKLPQKGGVEEIDKAIEDLGKEARKDPALRPIYHYLGGQVAQALEGVHRVGEDVHGQPAADQQPAGSPGAAPAKKGPDPLDDIWSGKDQPADQGSQKGDMNAEPKPYESNDQVADYLQYHLGFPVKITSGPRDAEHNKEVGGVPNSQHLKGEAWDFEPKGVSIAQAARQVVDSGMEFDQLEITPTHLHISFDPQNRHSIVYGGRELALVNPDHFGSDQLDSMQDDDDIDMTGMDDLQ